VATRIGGLAVLALMLAVQASAREQFTLHVGDRRVGYAYWETQQQAGERISVLYYRVAATQFRKSTVIERTVRIARDGKGLLKSMQVESLTGGVRSGWSGAVDVGRGRMVRKIVAREGRDTVPLPVGLRLPDERLQVVAPLWSGRTDAIEFQSLEASRAAGVKMRARVVERHSQTSVVRIRIAGDAGTTVEELWLDPAGNVQRIEQPFYGGVLRWMPCAEQCDQPVASFDPMSYMVVRSPYRIPIRALQGPIRYVLTLPPGFGGLPNTYEQAVSVADDVAVVTVCHDCGSERSANPQDAFLQPNSWVQSDDPRVRSFAFGAAGKVGSTAHRMQRLVLAVRGRLTGSVDYLGYATATDFLQSRSGDCTEMAVLLAAAARAIGIPARVVTGLAYADRFSGKKDVFSPHMWVQAWDGQHWISYDAALEGFDATHLALAVGDGNPKYFEAVSQSLSGLKIQKLGVVRRN
jgi:transglutaminase-like putative cysteine protease